MNCPKCDAELEHEPAEPESGIMCGGWYCEACDLFTGDDEVDREPLPGDVQISGIDLARPLGTPISELSGKPGTPGYVRFKAIARSWGYD